MSRNKWSRPRPELPDNQLYADEAIYIAELQRFIRTVPQTDGGIRLIAIDGIYGPETGQAVADFQRDYGLPATGRADNRTWNMIFSEYERNVSDRPVSLPEVLIPSDILTIGSSGVAVLLLQALINQLAERYINVMTVPYSGDYDTATSAAVEELQRILRLPASGDTDRATWLAMFSLL